MKPLGICCGRSFYDRDTWHIHQLTHRKDKEHNAMARTNDLKVIETDNTAWIGHVEEIDKDHIKVTTGFAGRPVIIPRNEIQSITPANEHPLVEWS